MLNKDDENKRRLENLYKESHGWLMAVAFNTSKDRDIANELVSELYLYLAEKVNPSIWWGVNSMNLMYCHAFIKTRFLNKIKVLQRLTTISPYYDTIDEEYDIEFDEKLDIAYNQTIEELKAMERTKNWPASKLYQMYAFNDEMTLDKLSREVKISKSTAFLQIKKAKKHLKETINNPFK
jgi:DNA-directed RNA polymerase specialized sigma24 family protein